MAQWIKSNIPKCAVGLRHGMKHNNRLTTTNGYYSPVTLSNVVDFQSQTNHC